MQMTIYDAVTVGSRSNCVYPNPVTVTDADTMSLCQSCHTKLHHELGDR